MTVFYSLLNDAISMAIVFLFGCTGEILMEKSGHLNLGVPGVMCFGTLGGYFGAYLAMTFYAADPSTAIWIVVILFALLFSILFSLIGGLIYGFLTVTLRCNQNVTGLALTTFGAGVADYFMNKIATGSRMVTVDGSSVQRLNASLMSRAGELAKLSLPFARNFSNTSFGAIIFKHGIFVYLAIVIAILAAIFLSKSRTGLNLRAVGENPATADSAGINVTAYKYGAILTGSAISGLGGCYYVLDYTRGSWENSATIQSFGWLAVAIVIFSVWKPGFAILASLIFGLLYIMPYHLGLSTVMMNVVKSLPYIVTVIILIFTSIFGKRSVQPPASLGQSYFREER